MRGDPPRAWRIDGSGRWSTPHARGSTWHRLLLGWEQRVYPACAGIHPSVLSQSPLGLGLPRMRGDPPFLSTPQADMIILACAGSLSDSSIKLPCLPHAWDPPDHESGGGDAPPHARIHPILSPGKRRQRSLRMRGDPPHKTESLKMIYF